MQKNFNLLRFQFIFKKFKDWKKSYPITHTASFKYSFLGNKKFMKERAKHFTILRSHGIKTLISLAENKKKTFCSQPIETTFV